MEIESAGMINDKKRELRKVSYLLLLSLLASCYGDADPSQEPPGEDESITTNALESGASALQSDAPLDPMNIYLVGFHPMKENPSHQIEAHHYCQQMNEDFAQCVLFDGNTGDANLTGIEYIISEDLFESLPDHERQYWHPHNYEILSGQLIAPGIPDIGSKKLMRGKMNSYGKTWHVWSTGTAKDTGDKLPLGDPKLAWSFNRDGEANPGLVEERDKRIGIDSKEIRSQRKEFIPLANPQEGVDAIKGEFSQPTESIPGVEAKKTETKVDSSKEN